MTEAAEMQLAEGESPGFLFLSEAKTPGVIAFKLLEVAHADHPATEATAEQSEAEQRLLELMLGKSIAKGALDAYKDCKARTARLESLATLDARACRFLSAFSHLYSDIRATYKPTMDELGLLLFVLVRDFGEYFGLLVDDDGDKSSDNVRRLAALLQTFSQSEYFLPRDEAQMRLPMDEMAADVIDYEIARTLDGHLCGVHERRIAGIQSGEIDDDVDLPVSYHAHGVKLRYAPDVKSDAERKAIKQILPLFLQHRFEGFESLEMAGEFIALRSKKIPWAEKQCFAVLQCLRHFGGRLPESMPVFPVSDVRKAAKEGYRALAREIKARKSGQVQSLRERMSGAFDFGGAISFRWVEDDEMPVAFWGDYSDVPVVFLPEEAVVRVDGEPLTFRFVCFVTEDDVDHDRPFVFGFQTTIDGKLYDAFAAARGGFPKAPREFHRLMAIEPVVHFASGVLHPGEADAGTDVEEFALLRAFCAMMGGVKSQTMQMFTLSDTGSSTFFGYHDVAAYVRLVAFKMRWSTDSFVGLLLVAAFGAAGCTASSTSSGGDTDLDASDADADVRITRDIDLDPLPTDSGVDPDVNTDPDATVDATDASDAERDTANDADTDAGSDAADVDDDVPDVATCDAIMRSGWTGVRVTDIGGDPLEIGDRVEVQVELMADATSAGDAWVFIETTNLAIDDTSFQQDGAVFADAEIELNGAVLPLSEIAPTVFTFEAETVDDIELVTVFAEVRANDRACTLPRSRAGSILQLLGGNPKTSLCVDMEETRSVQVAPAVALRSTDTYLAENGARDDLLAENFIFCPQNPTIVHETEFCVQTAPGQDVTLAGDYAADATWEVDDFILFESFESGGLLADGFTTQMHGGGDTFWCGDLMMLMCVDGCTAELTEVATDRGLAPLAVAPAEGADARIHQDGDVSILPILPDDGRPIDIRVTALDQGVEGTLTPGLYLVSEAP